MIGCSLLVHRCCFVKIDFYRFFSSKHLWCFYTLPERCCDTMVFIHPMPVLTHPTGGIDIRTCIQADSTGNRKKECTRYVRTLYHSRTYYRTGAHTHTQNLKPSASLFRGSKGGEGNYSNSGHGREGMGRDGHDIGWEGAIR